MKRARFFLDRFKFERLLFPCPVSPRLWLIAQQCLETLSVLFLLANLYLIVVNKSNDWPIFDWLRVECQSIWKWDKTKYKKWNDEQFGFLVKWKFDILVYFKDLIQSKESNDRLNLIKLLTTHKSQRCFGNTVNEYRIHFIFLPLNVNQIKVLFMECGWRCNYFLVHSFHSLKWIILNWKTKK